MSITPKNWDAFQHYKDRAPAWIKLHRGLLDDFAFSRLPVASRALAPLLWLLASEYEGGKITADFDELAFRFRMTKGELCEALNPLIEGGFFNVDSTALAACKQEAIPEKRDIENIDKKEGEKKKRSQSSRGASLPNDWKPTNEDIDYGISQGLTGEQIAVAAEDMRLWAKANSNRSIGRKADWSATFKSWMRRNRGKSDGKSQSGIIEAQRKLVAGAVSFGPRPSLAGSGAGTDPVRMLPEGRGERPGNLHSGDNCDPGGISPGGDPACHGPTDGDSAEDQMASDAARG